MCIFGAVSLLISLVFSVKKRLPEEILGSLISLLCGYWLLSSQSLIWLFPEKKLTRYAEFGALYACLPLIMLLFGITCGYLRRRRYILSVVSCIIMELSIILLRIAGIGHKKVQVAMCIIYLLHTSIIFFYCIRFSLKQKLRESSRIQMAGIASIVFSMMCAAIYYVISGSSSSVFNTWMGMIISLGTAVFVMSRMMSYVYSVTDSATTHQQEKSLSEMAYRDSLTGLPNRAACDNQFMSLDDSDLDYLIISLDLNGLKELNDTHGHAMGDQLLSSFANILNTAFPAPCFKARVSGDEFVVIIRSFPSENYLSSCIQRMKNLLNEFSESSGFDHSAAYGYCYRHEVKSGDSHSVYMKADERMYEKKRLQHELKALQQ
jgi:diguanylate cyclase (GGDEF)-like protein